MSLPDDIQGALDIAQSVFGEMEGDVIHKAWLGQSGSGVPVFAAPVVRKAIVNKQVKNVYTAQGELVLTKASLLFLQPIPPSTSNPPFKRANPIDPQDVFILPDGTTGPVVLSGGLMNANTNQPYYNEVYLGV